MTSSTQCDGILEKSCVVNDVAEQPSTNNTTRFNEGRALADGDDDDQHSTEQLEEEGGSARVDSNNVSAPPTHVTESTIDQLVQSNAADVGTEFGARPTEPEVREMAKVIQTKLKDALMLRRPARPGTETNAETIATQAAVASLRRARMGVRIAALRKRFMFRRATDLRDASATDVQETLDGLLGIETRGSPQAIAQVPLETEEDSVAGPPLPRTRAMAEALPHTMRAGTKETVHLPWCKEGPPTHATRRDTTPRQWGPTLKTSTLSSDERTTLRKLLEKELRCGALSVEDPSEIKVLTPVHVVRSGASSKPRLIHDLRPVNAWLRQPGRTNFERVRDALAIDVKWATKIDIMNAFKHVRVAETDRKWLAFAIDDVVFRWNTLPFGLSWSPLLFQEALRPAVDKLRAEGVKIVVYMDDLFVGADNPNELDEHTCRTLEILKNEGWTVAKDKVFPWAHPKLRFLGLLVDLEERRLKVPKSKAKKLEDLCATALANPSNRIPLASLQKIVGLLAFFLAAANFVALAWRGLLGAMAEAEALPGRHVWIRGRLKQELEFWQTKATDLTEATGVNIDVNRSAVIVSDGSESGAGALVWDSRTEAPNLQKWAAGLFLLCDNPSLRSFALPTEALSHSSTDRELRALELTLRHLISENPTRWRSRTYFWYSDSTCAVAAISKWRSHSDQLTESLGRIWGICIDNSISIIPHWCSREFQWLPAADFLSRVVGRRAQAEWSVSDTTFDWIIDRLREPRPAIDAFASRANTKLPKFFSRFPEEGSLGPALAERWLPSAGTYWAFPPFSQVGETIGHWRRSPGTKMILLAPEDHPAVVAAWRNGDVLRSAPFPAGHRLIDPNSGREAPHGPTRRLRAFLIGHSGPEARARRAAAAKSWLDRPSNVPNAPQ